MKIKVEVGEFCSNSFNCDHKRCLWNFDNKNWKEDWDIPSCGGIWDYGTSSEFILQIMKAVKDEENVSNL